MQIRKSQILSQLGHRKIEFRAIPHFYQIRTGSGQKFMRVCYLTYSVTENTGKPIRIPQQFICLHDISLFQQLTDASGADMLFLHNLFGEPIHRKAIASAVLQHLLIAPLPVMAEIMIVANHHFPYTYPFHQNLLNEFGIAYFGEFLIEPCHKQHIQSRL